MNLCLLLTQPQRTFPFNHRSISVSSCCLPHFLLLLFCQSDHRVPGELWAASQPGHWEERLPGERAGWEGVSPGLGTEVKGWSSRWLLTTSSLTHHCCSSLFVSLSWSLFTAAPCLCVLGFFFCRSASGTGSAGEAVGREQDVCSQFAHSGQSEDGLGCSGLSVSTCDPSKQKSGQRFRQPDRSLLPVCVASFF